MFDDVWKGKIASLYFFTKGSFVVINNANNSGLCTLFSTSSNITYMSDLSSKLKIIELMFAAGSCDGDGKIW